MPHRPTAPPTTLFTRTATVAPGETALLLHSDDVALAAWLVERVGPGGRVTALHTSHSALQRLARVPGLAVSDAVYPDAGAHGPADAALLALPKGREHIRAYLWTAAHALRPGGRLYLAGPNDAGARSAIRDAAALCGAAPTLGHKGGCRIALAVRPAALTLPTAWDGVPPWLPQTRTIRRPEGDYTLVTLPGVFSWDHLDDGTALLLDHLGAGPGLDVLDIGCGTGILGLAAARAGARVTLVDDNLLAVRCAQASARANDLADRCTVLPGDVTDAVRDRSFDLVVCNPPFHQGVAVTTDVALRIVREAHGVLRPGGSLRLVANRFLPYERALRETFGNATTVALTGRYQVLAATRRAP